MERSITIVVASTATIIFILLLAGLAMRRRRMVARLSQHSKEQLANKVVFQEVWWQEKAKTLTLMPHADRRYLGNRGTATPYRLNMENTQPRCEAYGFPFLRVPPPQYPPRNLSPTTLLHEVNLYDHSFIALPSFPQACH